MGRFLVLVVALMQIYAGINISHLPNWDIDFAVLMLASILAWILVRLEDDRK